MWITLVWMAGKAGKGGSGSGWRGDGNSGNGGAYVMDVPEIKCWNSYSGEIYQRDAWGGVACRQIYSITHIRL